MKNNAWVKRSMIALAAFSFTGCASSPSKPADAPATEPAEKVYPPAPAGSPLSKIKVDMGINEVYATIGTPTDTSSYVTGKAWIPFYYGGDTHRMEARYKGQGRVIFAPNSAFSGDMRVISVEYDPTETGYK
jgi:hypothetical protein